LIQQPADQQADSAPAIIQHRINSLAYALANEARIAGYGVVSWPAIGNN
jgi:hypothetical protein